MGAYVRLGSRRSLEDMLDHRRRIARQLQFRSMSGYDFSMLSAAIDEEIALIEKGIARISDPSAPHIDEPRVKHDENPVPLASIVERGFDDSQISHLIVQSEVATKRSRSVEQQENRTAEAIGFPFSQKEPDSLLTNSKNPSGASPPGNTQVVGANNSQNDALIAQARLAERQETIISEMPAASADNRDDPNSSLINSVVELLKNPPELMRSAQEERTRTAGEDRQNSTTAPLSLFDEYTLGGKLPL